VNVNDSQTLNGKSHPLAVSAVTTDNVPAHGQIEPSVTGDVLESSELFPRTCTLPMLTELKDMQLCFHALTRHSMKRHSDAQKATIPYTGQSTHSPVVADTRPTVPSDATAISTQLTCAAADKECQSGAVSVSMRCIVRCGAMRSSANFASAFPNMGAQAHIQLHVDHDLVH
jgi:hypothetical protein